MRNCWFLFLWFIPLQTAFAQTFFATPGPVHEQELNLLLANECVISFENPSGDSLQLRWKRVEVSFPPGWDIDLCDFGACYTGIPNGALMNTAAPSEQPYLKLVVQPDTTPGAGWLWFRVWDAHNSAIYEDVFFSLYTAGTTAAAEPAGGAGLGVWPNPAKERLTIRNPAGFPVSATLTASDGRICWSGTLSAQQNTILNIAAWPRGYYFLNAFDQTRPILLLH